MKFTGRPNLVLCSLPRILSCGAKRDRQTHTHTRRPKHGNRKRHSHRHRFTDTTRHTPHRTPNTLFVNVNTNLSGTNVQHFFEWAKVVDQMEVWRHTSDKSSRIYRCVKFVLCLMWLVHLSACGLYLVASLHEEPLNTWVYRRTVSDDDTLMNSSPVTQWLTSMYFVITVITTVGFGDMSAYTSPEIVYIILMMLGGTTCTPRPVPPFKLDLRWCSSLLLSNSGVDFPYFVGFPCFFSE